MYLADKFIAVPGSLQYKREEQMHPVQKRLIEKNQRLFEVASYGRPDVIKFLIDRGAEIDVSHALFAASSYNHLECVELLLNLGANIEEVEPRTDMTPLQRAVENNSVDTAKLLIKKGRMFRFLMVL